MTPEVMLKGEQSYFEGVRTLPKGRHTVIGKKIWKPAEKGRFWSVNRTCEMPTEATPKKRWTKEVGPRVSI
jgi:hypothetical protein